MAEFDQKSYIKSVVAIKFAAYAAIADGEDVDTLGFESATMLVQSGTIGAGTANFQLEEADDDGAGAPDTYAAVADADMIGVESDLTLLATNDDEARALGYIGKKRWIRLQNIESSAWTTHNHGAQCLLGNPKRVPAT